MLKRLAAACLILISEALIMQRNFERSMPLVLKHEGGFVNHPRDPGGATMKGVTLATFRQYVPGATVADLKAISGDMLNRIYRDGYWNEVRGDDLPAGVDYAVFDFAVNSGPNRAVKYLQAAVGEAQDGKIGPKTLAAAAKANPAGLINAICDARLAFMRRIKGSDGRLLWDTFGKGWSSRVAGVRKEALRMAGEPQDAPKPAPAPSAPPKPSAPPTPARKPPVAFPVEPGTVIVIKDGSKPKPEGPFWRLMFWLLGLIFKPKGT